MQAAYTAVVKEQGGATFQIVLMKGKITYCLFGLAQVGGVVFYAKMKQRVVNVQYGYAPFLQFHTEEYVLVAIAGESRAETDTLEYISRYHEVEWSEAGVWRDAAVCRRTLFVRFFLVFPPQFHTIARRIVGM